VIQLTPQPPGAEAKHAEVQFLIEDKFLEVSREDDFVGVQSYTSQPVDATGIVPHPPASDNTLTGWAYRPDALGIALRDVAAAVSDGIDIRGYLHWSLLDNFEWGRWTPTFGLIAVDRETFERRPKPSLSWLGAIARANAI